MTTFYSRPDGGHVHASKECPMLQGGDFEELGYEEITLNEARIRGLLCCSCMNKVFGKTRKRRKKDEVTS